MKKHNPYKSLHILRGWDNAQNPSVDPHSGVIYLSTTLWLLLPSANAFRFMVGRP